MIAPLITEAEVRKEAGLQNNTNITDPDILVQIKLIHGTIVGSVAGRYSIQSIENDESFDQSPAYEHLRNIAMMMTKGAVLLRDYGIQEGSENNSALDDYNQGKAELENIVAGNVRLIDKDGNEYKVVPKGSKSTTYAPTAVGREEPFITTAQER